RRSRGVCPRRGAVRSGRRHPRLIADFGGLWTAIPAFSALFLVVTLSSAGLPGLNGFVGEFLVLLGAFRVNGWLAAAAARGIIFAPVFPFWMFQRVIFCQPPPPAPPPLP